MDELWLYRWELPDDLIPLYELISDTLLGRVDVMMFTSQVQVRHLFQVADRYGWSQLRLSDALNYLTVVAAVGPTCADALRRYDVVPDVVPTHPKMGHMVNELAAYVRTRRGTRVTQAT